MVRTLITYAIPATTFALLVAVGLDLRPVDFARVRQRPGVVAAGLLAPIVMLPPLAIALIWLFQPDPTVAASMLLIAACPIGGVSNTYSYLARATPALSVTLTGISCLGASVTIPLISKGLELALDRPFGYGVPFTVLLGQLLIALALPLAVGMFVRHRAPNFAERHAVLFQRVAFFGVGLTLLLVGAEDPRALAQGVSSTVPLAAVFVIGSIAVGWMVGMLVTDDRRDRFTLAAEFGARNISIAIIIAVSILGRVEFARFALIYALVEVPLMLLAIALFRRCQATTPARHVALSA